MRDSFPALLHSSALTLCVDTTLAVLAKDSADASYDLNIHDGELSGVARAEILPPVSLNHWILPYGPYLTSSTYIGFQNRQCKTPQTLVGGS